MFFPPELVSRPTWAVRFKGDGKQPRSPHSNRPIEYEPKDDEHADAWNRRWNDPCVLGSFEQAKSVLERHDRAVGLTHVIHHFGDHEPKTRIVCFDFDDAIVDGVLNPVVRGHVEFWQSYTSYSGSRTGLHLFLRVTDCPAFRNQLVVPVGGPCKVDVLCCNPVAVTGEVFEGYKDLVTIGWDELQAFPLFTFKEPTKEHDIPDWWTEDPLDGVPGHLEHLIPQMQMVEAIEGQGGSKVLFAAACEVLRHGVTGREAEALLRCVPAIPPFPPEQIQRTVECAFQHVQSDGEFGVLKNTGDEFPLLEEPKPEPKDIGEERAERYGFPVWTVAELDERDETLEYVVEGALVPEGATYVGGREKSFKTGVATDLLFSLATGTPWLNSFTVNRPMRGVLFTAEVGLKQTQRLLRAMAADRGIKPANVHTMEVSNHVPTFSYNKHQGQWTKEALGVVEKLKLYVKERKPEVAVIDPLYFALGAASVGDMYETGNVLRKISDELQDLGVWPIFCHHSKKDSNSEFEPMDLNDFYGSGVGAHARQWVLLSHSEPYRGGVARLFANIGGSSQGARGLFNVTIDEGQPDDLCDRTWRVSAEPIDDDTPTMTKKERFLDVLRGGKAESIADIAILAKMGEKDVRELVADFMAEDDPIITMQNRKISLLKAEF